MLRFSLGARRRAATYWSGKVLALTCLCSLAGSEPVRAADADTNAVPDAGYTLPQVRQWVLQFNESLQMKLIDAQIGEKLLGAEKGIFEPALVGSYSRVDSARPNTEEEKRALSLGLGTLLQVFDERNDLYDAGLEFLSPIGSRFRIGYSLHRLNNNLNFRLGTEYVTTMGATLTQPLLKSFGTAATLAKIRLAAVASDQAFQDYRRQIMLIVSRAEAAYWDLYLTQEQERISGESVNVAGTIAQDTKAMVEVGKASELDSLQANAGLAARKSRLVDAQLKRSEAANQLVTLFSGHTADRRTIARVKDQPVAGNPSLSYQDSFLEAVAANPDYLTRMEQIQAEKIRVAFAQNQKLPQLDLKASYGLNGLGRTTTASFDDITHAGFAAWSLGVEMRVPLTGGVRERNELDAAKLSQQKALLGLKEIEVQIGNTLDATLFRLRNLKESVANYQAVADFHQKSLETQLEKLKVGKADSRLVLETEQQLFEAKVSVVDSLVQYQRAALQLELVEGSILKKRSLEITKNQLKSKTAQLLQQANLTPTQTERLRAAAAAEYEKASAEAKLASARGASTLSLPAGRPAAATASEPAKP